MQGGLDGPPGRLCCNGCWGDCSAEEHAVAASCGHLYCLACCQTIMESDDSTCAICNQLLQKSNCKAVNPKARAQDMMLALAGQTPDVILKVAGSGIAFYNKQQALYAEYAQAQSQRKINKTQDQCRKKLQEVHNGYVAAKRKYQEVLAQKHALAEDCKELQEKYNQKAMQDKKLKENFAMLQQENEALRRQIAAMQKGGGGGGGGMMQGLAPGFGLGGGGGGGAGGRSSRMAGVLGLEEGLGRRPGTVLAPRALPPDPSPLASMLAGSGGGYPGGGGNSFGYDTPDAQPVMRQLHASGGSGGGSAGRMLGLGAGGGGLGGLGRASGGMGGDKRHAMGFNAHNSMATM